MSTPIVVVPWHNKDQKDSFLKAWNLDGNEPNLILQQDKKKHGCGATKNEGIKEAIRRDASFVVILDDDLYPTDKTPTLRNVIEQHAEALKPQQVTRYRSITTPPSRGTPYFNRTITMPVAASFGWWSNIPDRDAVRQLADGAYAPMEFHKEPVFGDYFSGSGMNCAFDAKMWWPFCQFVKVSRWDDIWAFWLFQRAAYDLGYCFSFTGPTLHHQRQSAVFKNLVDEARYLEQNESLWEKIATHPKNDYESLRKLLPV